MERPIESSNNLVLPTHIHVTLWQTQFLLLCVMQNGCAELILYLAILGYAGMVFPATRPLSKITSWTLSGS